MEARCTALAVRVVKQKSRQKPKMPLAVQVRALLRKQKSRQKPKIPSTVQVRALVRKENWDPYTWDGTVSDNDAWNWEDEVEARVTELGGVESGEGRVGEIEGEKGVYGGQIQKSRLVRDYTQSELLERTRMFRQMPVEPLFKWLVRSWGTGAKDALQNPFTLGPITEGDPFELDMIVQDDVDDVVIWSLWQRQGKKRVPQDWALVEIERITDDRPVTLKTWVPLLESQTSAAVGSKANQLKKSTEKGRVQAISTRHREAGNYINNLEMGPTIPDMFKQPLQGMCLGPSLPRKEAPLETTLPALNDALKDVDQAQREGVDHPASDLARSMDGDGSGDSPQVRSVVLNSLTTAEEGMALGEKCGTILSGSGTTLQIPKQSESELFLPD
ncbi:hypothetical protein NDU88_001082 [Pleurodeles waltl]|uniref:Uncharacterized protein n=1 Tax=Pleurodeles waltl TaxID=8319 RepID=A0AAV7L9Z8_PLEWA|nr:hypothetical protein NDU88_001082 [Pleurodeles waltl]